MEKQNNQICTGLLRNCPAAAQADKKITKKETENEIVKGNISLNGKNDEKPWSIFADVYWI
ncbi:MAG: hypothetical protein H0W73_10700 [Bacteroidetes bacterium]|nr:hypothetical protein [Bacteroidota bacterium]